MTPALAVTAVLVFVMGMAIQRGNTCTVVAIDDLIHRRSWHRVQAIAFIWFLVAGGLALTHLITGRNPAPELVPVATWSVLGGLLLGAGAVINGAFVITSDTGRSWSTSKRMSRLVMMPSRLLSLSVTGRPEMRKRPHIASTSARVFVGRHVTGSVTMPASDRLTVST